jgi:hypothetical protein
MRDHLAIRLGTAAGLIRNGWTKRRKRLAAELEQKRAVKSASATSRLDHRRRIHRQTGQDGLGLESTPLKNWRDAARADCALRTQLIQGQKGVSVVALDRWQAGNVPRDVQIRCAADELDRHLIGVRRDDWNLATGAHHCDVHTVYAAAVLFAEPQLSCRVGEHAVSRPGRVGQDILCGDPGDERTRGGDAEYGRRVLHGHGTRQTIVAVDEPVGDPLAHGQLRKILELDLLTIWESKWGAVEPRPNHLHDPRKRHDDRLGQAFNSSRLAARRGSELVHEPAVISLGREKKHFSGMVEPVTLKKPEHAQQVEIAAIHKSAALVRQPGERNPEGRHDDGRYLVRAVIRSLRGPIESHAVVAKPRDVGRRHRTALIAYTARCTSPGIRVDLYALGDLDR